LFHLERGTEKLTGFVGREVVGYLNKFPALENPADIVAWKKFCENHPSKELRSMFHLPYFLDIDSIIQIKDWYAHKTMYPWLLPGFNRTLSRMPQKFWESTPRDSNLVETAHVATNRNTSIRLTPLEAIEK
jgi:hypothetical protein